jgi:hypothetical protein
MFILPSPMVENWVRVPDLLLYIVTDLRIIVAAPHLLLYTDFSVANRILRAFVERR